MNRSRLLLVTLITITCALAAAAFKTISVPSAHVGSLKPAAPMLEPRSGQTATLLPDGRVLIAGGMRRNQDFYKSAELYDPATGKFYLTGEMNVARVGHVAVLLGSGKVLVAGGWVGQGGTDSAELYDPATGKFTPIAKMTTRRGRPSATLLRDGDVLIAGGEERDNESLMSAELFHVKSLSFQPTGSMHHARISHTATLQRWTRSDRGWLRRQHFGARGTVRSEGWHFHGDWQFEWRTVQTYGRPACRWKSADCGWLGFPRLEREPEQRGDLRSAYKEIHGHGFDERPPFQAAG